MVKELQQLAIVVLAKRMSGIYDIGVAVALDGGELRLQGLNHHAGAQIGTADAYHHHQLAFALQPGYVGLEPIKHLSINLFRQVHPAEKVISGGIAVQ